MPGNTERVAKLKTESWLFVCVDGEKTAPLREQHLFGHLDHIEAHNDRYRVAGPLREEPGGPITGSFFIVEADSREAAWDLMRGDPYIASGMYEAVTVRQCVPACGAWMGGVIWDQDEIRADMPKYT
ncbi:MAG: hypothetical protein GDA35_02305 [Hyphomonadaceae bacterium]|nr:hypothetical protein [Hyphomonadaceae bacterium]